jgi:FAD/FMN-containing dehydrogenase
MSKYDSQFKRMSASNRLIAADDERMESYREDTMVRGEPDAVLIARDEDELIDAMTFCNAESIPITICGSQTSMTGASIANGGLLVSTEKLEGVEDIYKEGDDHIVVARSGTVVSDLQAAVEAEGLFYPVAPTSRDECRIGANIATNATGEDSYKYGPVRSYVRRMEIVLPDGTKKILERTPNEIASPDLNKAGYFLDWKNPMDLIIGSEGTLCFVSRVWLFLLKGVPNFFSALIPFMSNREALKFVSEITLARQDLNPRTLELIDSGALSHMKSAQGFPTPPEGTGAYLYIKQEYSDEAEMNGWLEKWYEASVLAAGESMGEGILIAITSRQQEEFRLWRHKIPESANEVGRKYWSAGGGKVGSDWWVPAARLIEMMEYFYKVSDATGLDYMGYAHIGDGHPHTNLISTNPEEKQKALKALESCCRKAVELGGGVAGEHGLGKLHADQLAIQHGADIIERMKSWKKEYDPNWILGQGNIFTR